MSLTDTAIRNAKPNEKAYKLPDEKGMYLLISPTGSKLWRFNYRFGGKHKTLAIGSYPEISLAEARDYRDQARKLLANDIDPSEVKRVEKQQREIISSNSFEAVARDWFDRHLSQKAETTKAKVTSEGWLYLAGHKDLFSGDLAGYAMSERMTKNLITQSLFRGVAEKRPPRGLIHHSDRGSQYCAEEYRAILDHLTDRAPS